jgi:hypothetical protein
MRHHRLSSLRLLLVFALLVCPMGVAMAEGYLDHFPTTPDPLVGDYAGRWTEDEEVDPAITAQVIALGGDRYHVILAAKLAMRCPPKLAIDVKAVNGKITFDEDGMKGVCDGTTFTGGKRAGNSAFSMTKLNTVSPTLGKAAPEGAIALFDGTGLDHWNGTEGWDIVDSGTLMVTPKGKYLETKEHFGDLEMHIEFRLPFMPTARGQQRGNSGVFIYGEYETQVLDSYGLPGYYDECGGLYKLAAPLVNACLPPLAWQTYDINFRAPRYGADGKVTENARITVYQNGVLIQDDVELKWITAWKEKERLAPPPAGPGPIKLQGHNNYVQYRNIWVLPAKN